VCVCVFLSQLYVSLSPYVSLGVSLTVYVCVSECVCLSQYVCVCLIVCVSLYLLCVCIQLAVCLRVSLSVCAFYSHSFMFLSLSVCVCLSQCVCLTLRILAIGKSHRGADIGRGVPVGFSASHPETNKSSVNIVENSPDPSRGPEWESSSLLPSFIDRRFYLIAKARLGYLYESQKGYSNIDDHLEFLNAGQMIVYLPRALQILLFSPFPNQWGSHGTSPSASIFRRVGGVETLFRYLLFPFFLVAIAAWYHRAELWLILSFCLTIMMVQSYIVVNMGTLYRMRYGFIMTLVALSMLGLGKSLQWWKQRKTLPSKDLAASNA